MLEQRCETLSVRKIECWNRILGILSSVKGHLHPSSAPPLINKMCDYMLTNCLTSNLYIFLSLQNDISAMMEM